MPLSTFLNGRASTQLRGLLWLSLSESGNILALTNTSDTGGGATQAWVAGTAIPCRVDPLNRMATSEVAGRVDERSTHTITVPPGTVASPNDRFAVTGRGTFEITATHDRTGEFAHVFEVLQVS